MNESDKKIIKNLEKDRSELDIKWDEMMKGPLNRPLAINLMEKYNQIDKSIIEIKEKYYFQ